MTNVDYERFPPQHALEKVKGRAEGVCFKGVCAVSQRQRSVVVLIAADMETLEVAWDAISVVPLNRDGVQCVAIFSQDALTPNVEFSGGAPLHGAASAGMQGSASPSREDLLLKGTEMDENLRNLIFEACNDWMCARLPMTEAMHSAFLASTGDRGKYPNALDTLARLALETPNDRVEGRDAASSRRVPSHDGLAGTGDDR